MRSVFTEKIKESNFDRMKDNIRYALEGINNTPSIKCPHLKEVNTEDGGIEDFEAKLKHIKNETREYVIGDQTLSIKGTTYKCKICGKEFFVPTAGMGDENLSERERVKRFVTTGLNLLNLVKNFLYAEPIVRGLFDEEVALNVPAKIRSMVGKSYLFELAGFGVYTDDSDGRTSTADVTVQLDRALFLAHLEAIDEVYRGLNAYFEGQVTGDDEVELGAFFTSSTEQGFQPHRKDVPVNIIGRSNKGDTKYIDMVSPGKKNNTIDKTPGSGRSRRDRDRDDSGEMKKDV